MSRVTQVCGYHDPFGGPCILPVGHKYPNGKRSSHEDQEGLDAMAERARQSEEYKRKRDSNRVRGG